MDAFADCVFLCYSINNDMYLYEENSFTEIFVLLATIRIELFKDLN
jgi:hypothetical protein